MFKRAHAAQIYLLYEFAELCLLHPAAIGSVYMIFFFTVQPGSIFDKSIGTNLSCTLKLPFAYVRTYIHLKRSY